MDTRRHFKAAAAACPMALSLALALTQILASCSRPAAFMAPEARAPSFEKFETALVYSDGSAQFVSPQEPQVGDRVTVRLRVSKAQTTAAQVQWSDGRVDMALAGAEGRYDYWVAELPPLTGNLAYWFQLWQDEKTVYYSRRGVEQKAPGDSYRFKLAPGFDVPDWMKGAVLYQIFVDRFYNGDPDNDVVDGEYMYDNWPAVKVDDWNALPDGSRSYAAGSDRTREFFGGDLKGIIDKLGYLKDLGIDGIYLNPVFVSPSNHKYDTQDYRYVDPHFGVILKDGGQAIDPSKDPYWRSPVFGNSSPINKDASRYIARTTSLENLEASNALMRELVSQAHKLGIKVILDGVFNHAGSFGPWLDREGLYPDEASELSAGPGAYESADSPYRDWFVFRDQEAWPGNESYEAWYGYKTLPKLNYEGDPALAGTILKIVRDWTSGPEGVDGWRLDVAAELGTTPAYNQRFWRMFRDAVKDAKGDAVILAEVYGDSSAWLSGDQWDTIMNYDAFFEPVGFFLTGLEKHSYGYYPDRHLNARQFSEDLRERMAKLPWLSLETAMNQLSNHDHSRFLTRTSGFVDDQRPNKDLSPQSKADDGVNKGILMQATVMQMTMPGAPTLYYGDEAGLAGFTDPDSRRSYPWGSEDKKLLSFFKDIIALHKQYEVTALGSYAPLWAVDKGVFAFGRWGMGQRMVVVTNNNPKDKTLNIPVAMIDAAEGQRFSYVFRSDKEGHDASPGGSARVEKGAIKVSVPAYGSVILFAKDDRLGAQGLDALRPTVLDAVWVGDSAYIRFSAPMEQRLPEGAIVLPEGVKASFAWNGNTLIISAKGGKAPLTVKAGLAARDGGFSMAEDFILP